MGEEDIAKVLSRLTEDGFLGFDGGSYRYDCDAAQRAAVDHVAQVYAKQLFR